MDVADAKKLKTLEAESEKPKKLLSERDLEIEVMKEIAAKNAERARASSTGRVSAKAWPVVLRWVRATFGRPRAAQTIETSQRMILERPSCVRHD